MEQRFLLVQAMLKGEESHAALCRRFGISRPTGIKWLRRYQRESLPGLLDRSRAPRNHPQQMPRELAALILDLRQQHGTWGPRKLRAWLIDHYAGLRWPAASTIGDLLRRHQVTARPHRVWRTPPATAPFGTCQAPNDLWCADFKGWFRTGDGARCEPLTLSDAYSRYLLRCQALPRIRQDWVRAVLESAFRQYGLPRAIRTDNGPPFASQGLGGLSRLSIWWLKLGITVERIAPGAPQQNGRHERLHRTLKAETARPPQADLGSQQSAFEAFRRTYNEERPHEALGQRPPATAYRPSERLYPPRLPVVEYPAGGEVRVVRGDGSIKWRGDLLFVSELLKGEPVALTAVAEGRWLLSFCTCPLAVLDEQRGRLWPVHQALRRGLVPADVLRSPFRYAPGTSQDASKV
jgi:transposase InsO family protein